MDALDIFLLAVRWLHVLSAAAWVGGSIFYLVVLRPAIKRNPDTPRGLTSAAGAEFKTLVDACIIVLIATGAVLAHSTGSPRTLSAHFIRNRSRCEGRAVPVDVPAGAGPAAPVRVP